MNEIDRINDELRNYKLFKIQRVNTRKQEFDEIKSQILKTTKNELIDYFIIFINFIAVPYLLYNVIKSFDDRNFFSTNRTIILINFTIVIAVSIYTSIVL